MNTHARESWPPISFEHHDWQSSAALRHPRESLHPVRYQAALPPFIAERTPVVSSDTAQVAASATEELTRFDAELGHRVASFAPVLLRSEAASSSQIENLSASAQAIFSAELGAHQSRKAELIAANTRAMRAALELADNLSPDTIRALHRVLMADQPRHTPGEWRSEAVWIGARADSPVGAEYVAPFHTRIAPLIADLSTFTQRSDLHALLQTAVAHAQFETIHPFTDGNGRTGRALAQAMLRRHGVTRNVAVPVSAGLLADVQQYHEALTAYRAGNVDPIVRAFANASLRAVANARQLVADIDEIREGWSTQLTARKSSNAWRLLDVIVQRPVLDAATAAAELGVKQPNIYPPLRALVEAGILKSKSEDRLGPFWRSEELLHAIDGFAARAGRRERT